VRKVLVVDDSLTAIRQMEKIINESGDFVCVGRARSGLEAIRLHNELCPDIICMDLNMPDMDGLAALRCLKALDNDLKVVIVSSVGGADSWCLDALKLGASTVLSKPADAEKVLQVLRGL